MSTRRRSRRYSTATNRSDWTTMTGAVVERLVIATLAQRPDLHDKVFGPEIQSAVPEFMRHDRTAALYYGDGSLDRYLEYGLVAVDRDEPDRPVARAFAVPFA